MDTNYSRRTRIERGSVPLSAFIPRTIFLFYLFIKYFFPLRFLSVNSQNLLWTVMTGIVTDL